MMAENHDKREESDWQVREGHQDTEVCTVCGNQQAIHMASATLRHGIHKPVFEV